MSSTQTLTRQEPSRSSLSPSSIQLEAATSPSPSVGPTTRHDSNGETELATWNASTSLTAETDNVVLASQATDATAPDGGYGWIIVAACSVITFWFVGTTYSWGVIQEGLVDSGLAKPSILAFVGSLTVGCNAAFALVNSRLMRSIGARNLAYLGISLMGVGQILSGWALKSVAGLFVTSGFVMGYGVSCCFMVVSIVPAQYFSKRRGLANGLVFAGGGLGGAVISLAMSAIVENLGPAWTFRLIGMITLATGLPAAWLIKERVPWRASSFVEWRLFRDSKFAVLFVAGTVATFPLFVPPFFLPLYARSIGLTSRTGAILVASFNFSSALGRVLCGLMGDKLGPVNTLFISLAISATSMLALWPISTSLAPLIAFVIINGIGNGGFFAIMPTVVGNVFGSARVSVAMGMIVTGWTAGYFLGAPIAGFILDAYGGADSGFKSYRPAIFYAGSMALGSAGLVAYVRLRISRKPLKRL